MTSHLYTLLSAASTVIIILGVSFRAMRRVSTFLDDWNGGKQEGVMARLSKLEKTADENRGMLQTHLETDVPRMLEQGKTIGSDLIRRLENLENRHD